MLRAAPLLVALLTLSPVAACAARDPVEAMLGRWDVTVCGPDGCWPSWFELARGPTGLAMRFVSQVGGARPVRRLVVYRTLLGRRLTVVLNGTTLIADQDMPGTTGGALDSDEGMPGPVMLQGFLGEVAFRRIVLTPAR